MKFSIPKTDHDETFGSGNCKKVPWKVLKSILHTGVSNQRWQKKSPINGGFQAGKSLRSGPFSSKPCLMTKSKSHKIPLNHHQTTIFLWFFQPAMLTTGVIPKMTAFSIERQDDPRWWWPMAGSGHAPWRPAADGSNPHSGPCINIYINIYIYI